MAKAIRISTAAPLRDAKEAAHLDVTRHLGHKTNGALLALRRQFRRRRAIERRFHVAHFLPERPVRAYPF